MTKEKRGKAKKIPTVRIGRTREKFEIKTGRKDEKADKK